MLMPQPFPTPPAPYGVFRAVAPKGQIALTGIDSTGYQLFRFTMPEWLYAPEFEVLLWELLERADLAQMFRDNPRGMDDVLASVLGAFGGSSSGHGDERLRRTRGRGRR